MFFYRNIIDDIQWLGLEIFQSCFSYMLFREIVGLNQNDLGGVLYDEDPALLKYRLINYFVHHCVSISNFLIVSQYCVMSNDKNDCLAAVRNLFVVTFIWIIGCYNLFM